MRAKFIVYDDEDGSDRFKGARAAIDDEALCDDDEEDFEDGQDEFLDSFIDRSTEFEETSDVPETSKAGRKLRKLKRKERSDYGLDEDDFVLLEESGVPIPRQISGNRLKRLKKDGKQAVSDDEEQSSDEDDAVDVNIGSLSRRVKFNGKASKSIPKFKGSMSTESAKYRNGRAASLSKYKATKFRKIQDLSSSDSERSWEDADEDDMSDFIVYDDDMSDKEKGDNCLSRSKKAVKKPSGRGRKKEFANPTKRQKYSKQQWTSKIIESESNKEDSSKNLGCDFMNNGITSTQNAVKHDQIRETDIPERMQLLEEITGSPPQYIDTDPEAAWIYENLFAPLTASSSKEFDYLSSVERNLVIQEISNVLKMMHEERLEVPFIAMYRKEKCLNVLKDKDDGSQNSWDIREDCNLKYFKVLWAIQLWDEKWLLLKRRKAALKTFHEKRTAEEGRAVTEKSKHLDSILRSLNEATSEQSVNDIEYKLNLHFPSDEVEIEGQFKRPKRKSLYSIYRKSGFGAISEKLCLSSEQLGDNLVLMIKKHEVEDVTTAPEEFVQKFCSSVKGDPQSVLKGARHMAAVEISCEPAVIEFVRTTYMEFAEITTNATKDGSTSIDSFHPYYEVQSLVRERVVLFEDAKWLLIEKAEEENLLKVSIDLSESIIKENLIPKLESQYLSDGLNPVSELWNEQRKLVLKDALHSHILPNLEKEARKLLNARAKAWLVQEYAMQFWKKVSVAPFTSQNNVKNDSDDGSSAGNSQNCIMACCQGFDKDPTTIVVLDSSGEVLEVIFASYLVTRPKNPVMETRKEIDRQAVARLMKVYRPQVVAVGAFRYRCKFLKDGISELCSNLEDSPPSRIVYVNEDLPRLYENSSISQDQLPKHRGIVRRAVAVGRYLLEPLAFVSNLCGPKREILSLNLHPMDSYLDLDERYKAIEQVMVTITNQVGINVNEAASHEWLFAPLQFVSGLGPIKSTHLQSYLVSRGLNNRRELLANGLLGEVVYKNVAGFLRVKTVFCNDTEDALEDSRIHPESYDLARRMAEFAYCEVEEKQLDSIEEEERDSAVYFLRKKSNTAKSIKHVMERVIQLMGSDKHQTLNDIGLEIDMGFQEWRTPYNEPDQDEEFCMLTGENDTTLATGKTIQVAVRKVQNNRVICSLESGMTGFLQREDLTDDRNVDLSEVLAEGRIITCQVKCIQKDRHLVDLTCKLDTFSNNQEQKDLSCNEQKPKESASKFFKPRLIKHSCFQNISAEDAAKLLSNKNSGEFVIRPSSKGPSYLTLTLKIFEDVYAHKEIMEKQKDQKDLTSFLKIGKCLSIGEESFGNLDELINKYVKPLAVKLESIVNNEKFTSCSENDIENLLRDKILDNPSEIPYCFSISRLHPGVFTLFYLVNSNPYHEYMGLTPHGLRFRKDKFSDLDELISYFLKHPEDFVQEMAKKAVTSGRSFDQSNRGRRGGRFEQGSRGRGRRGGRTGERSSTQYQTTQNDNNWGGSASDNTWGGSGADNGGDSNNTWGGSAVGNSGAEGWGVSAVESGGDRDTAWGSSAPGSDNPSTGNAGWGASSSDNPTTGNAGWGTSSNDADPGSIFGQNSGEGNDRGGYGRGRGRRGGFRGGERGGRRGGGRGRWGGPRDESACTGFGGNNDSAPQGDSWGWGGSASDNAVKENNGWGGSTAVNDASAGALESGIKPGNDSWGSTGWGESASEKATGIGGLSADASNAGWVVDSSDGTTKKDDAWNSLGNDKPNVDDGWGAPSQGTDSDRNTTTADNVSWGGGILKSDALEKSEWGATTSNKNDNLANGGTWSQSRNEWGGSNASRTEGAFGNFSKPPLHTDRGGGRGRGRGRGRGGRYEQHDTSNGGGGGWTGDANKGFGGNSGSNNDWGSSGWGGNTGGTENRNTTDGSFGGGGWNNDIKGSDGGDWKDNKNDGPSGGTGWGNKNQDKKEDGGSSGAGWGGGSASNNAGFGSSGAGWGSGNGSNNDGSFGGCTGWGNENSTKDVSTDFGGWGSEKSTKDEGARWGCEKTSKDGGTDSAGWGSEKSTKDVGSGGTGWGGEKSSKDVGTDSAGWGSEKSTRDGGFDNAGWGNENTGGASGGSSWGGGNQNSNVSSGGNGWGEGGGWNSSGRGFGRGRGNGERGGGRSWDGERGGGRRGRGRFEGRGGRWNRDGEDRDGGGGRGRFEGRGGRWNRDGEDRDGGGGRGRFGGRGRGGRGFGRNFNEDTSGGNTGWGANSSDSSFNKPGGSSWSEPVDTGSNKGWDLSTESSNSGWGSASTKPNNNSTSQGDGWGTSTVSETKGRQGDGWGVGTASEKKEIVGNEWGGGSSSEKKDSLGAGWGGGSSSEKKDSLGAGWGGGSSSEKKDSLGSGWGDDTGSEKKESLGDGWGGGTSSEAKGSAW